MGMIIIPALRGLEKTGSFPVSPESTYFGTNAISTVQTATDVKLSGLLHGNLVAGLAAVSGSGASTLQFANTLNVNVKMIQKGCFTAMSIGLSSARTAGTLTLAFTINGSENANTLVIDGSNTQYNYVVFGTPIDFEAGDSVFMKVTGSSFTPTATDVTACMFWKGKV